MSVNPTTVAGIACGTSMTVTYTATIHVAANGPGGTVKFTYTVTNGRGQTPASITFSPGQTIRTYTFTWSGALIQGGAPFGPGGIQVTSPNQLTSQLLEPTGQCQVAQAASWKVVSSPSPGPGAFDTLNGVAAVSANDVWAVGINSGGEGSTAQTLIEHWNGTTWQVVSSPNPGATDNSLNGVAAVSASNIWTVGLSQNGRSPSQTLIEHWNGTTWQVVSSPSPGGTDNGLSGVAAVSATNIWAVGESRNGGSPSQTLIEHWNGTTWQVVSSPNMNGSSLVGVAIVSSTNIWAVGNDMNSSSTSQTLIEHWNGMTWQVVSSPNPGATDNGLNGVAAVSASNIWAVGGYGAPSHQPFQTLIEHWNGTTWQVVSSPSPGATDNGLSGVAAVSATNIWAVGTYANLNDVGQVLIEHWNGTTWQVVSSPNVGGENRLRSVAAVSSSNLWAVGSYINVRFLTLTEEYS